jgi:hypothetical protein
LFWMHNGKETKDTGVICYGMIPSKSWWKWC